MSNLREYQKTVTKLIESNGAEDLTSQINGFTEDKGTAILSINIIYSGEFQSYKAFISYWENYFIQN